MGVRLPTGNVTVDEYLDLTDGTNRLIEYTDGKIEVLAMPTSTHQRLLLFLLNAFRDFVIPRDLGEVLFAALRVQVGRTKFREPDIVFMAKANKTRAQDRYWEGADLVAEIVSADAKSRERDLVTKRADYAAAGIAEYWIVDPAEKRITILGLAGADYEVVGEFTLGDLAASRLLKGFSVDVAAMFEAAKA